MTLPNRLPETGPFKKLYGWLNGLRDFVASLKPAISVGVETQHNKTGVMRRATRVGGDDDGENGSTGIAVWQ